MFDYLLTDSGNIEFKIDLNIYSDAVISKVLYWIAKDFTIECKDMSLSIRQVVLVPNISPLSFEKYIEYKRFISQLFVDFKVRELVRNETEAIRNILYLKAFANCSELEDLRGEE